jgi:hypothetical protein
MRPDCLYLDGATCSNPAMSAVANGGGPMPVSEEQCWSCFLRDRRCGATTPREERKALVEKWHVEKFGRENPGFVAFLAGERATVPLPRLTNPSPVAARIFSQPTTGSGGRGRSCNGCRKATPIQHSFLSRAQALAAAELEHAKDRHTLALPVIQKRRQTICNACPQKMDDGTCNLCGCPLGVNVLNVGKIAWRSESCPAGKWARHRDSYMPFTMEPKRNLLYFVMPWKERGIWQWNLDQLFKYLDVFNGRRLMAIATADVCDSAETVEAYAAGRGFEFIRLENDGAQREAVAFLPLWEAVQSLDPNEVSFFGHAKGQSHPEFFDPNCTIKPWCEIMYEVCLGDWPTIQDALESHCMAGAFKGPSRAFPGLYSGTFFWFRHKDAFARDWRYKIKRRWGIENWSAATFKESECWGLFHNCTQRLYTKHYFDAEVLTEFKVWKDSRG